MKKVIHGKYYLIKFIISVFLIISIFLFKETYLNNLNLFIGSVLVAYAIDEALFEIYCHKWFFVKKSKTYLALVELILGLTLLLFDIDFVITCIVWAVWSIVRESYEIKEIATESKHLIPIALSGLESIAVIIYSIILIVEPTVAHASSHLYLLIVELVLSCFVPFLDEIL